MREHAIDGTRIALIVMNRMTCEAQKKSHRDNDRIHTLRADRSGQEGVVEMANQNQGGQQSQSDRSSNQSRSQSGGGQSGGQGFAGMSDEEQRRIAQKGGEAVSEDRDHMADIGRKGGEASADSRSSSERSQSASSRSSDRDEQGGRGDNDRSSSSSRSDSGSDSSSGGRRNS